MVNYFTEKIDFKILLTSTQWRHAHAFTVTWIIKRAKEQRQYKILKKCWL
jgi:hypothetical protein